jgi:aryl-alcohol dehydrogenase-like predicted oxidoreductase
MGGKGELWRITGGDTAAPYVADLGGWTRFVSMQDQYNLIMREEEREMLPFCLDQGVGVLPWSPLARGRLMGYP